VLRLKPPTTRRKQHNARLLKRNKLLPALKAPQIRLCKQRKLLKLAAMQPTRDSIECSSSLKPSKLAA
jgi:hypothetical protein